MENLDVNKLNVNVISACECVLINGGYAPKGDEEIDYDIVIFPSKTTFVCW